MSLIAVGKHIELPKGVLPNDEPNDWCIVRFGESFYAYEDNFSQSQIDYVIESGGLVFNDRDSYNEWLRGEKEVGDEVVASSNKPFIAPVSVRLPLPELAIEKNEVTELESNVAREIEQIALKMQEIDGFQRKNGIKTQEDIEKLWSVIHAVVNEYKELKAQNVEDSRIILEVRSAMNIQRMALFLAQEKLAKIEVLLTEKKVSFFDWLKQIWKKFVKKQN